MLLFVDPVVARSLFFLLTNQKRRDVVDLTVQFRAVLSRARDNERRSRFIDQNRVHLVDDGIKKTPLTAMAHFVFHIVT